MVEDEERREQANEPEDIPREPAAAGGFKSSASNKLPGATATDDESPVGDTDQHSEG